MFGTDVVRANSVALAAEAALLVSVAVPTGLVVCNTTEPAVLGSLRAEATASSNMRDTLVVESHRNITSAPGGVKNAIYIELMKLCVCVFFKKIN